MEKERQPDGYSSALFGPLWKYVKNDSVTDIDYDGRNLWIITDKNERKKEDASEITSGLIAKIADQVGMRVELPLNVEHPVLEAEMGHLRITLVHESSAITGKTFTIRKSLPKLRFTAEQAIGENMYCSRETLSFLINLILAKTNIVFCGEPRHGKTECAKFLSQYIPSDQKVVTIEDTLEWHYKELNPGKNAVELKVNKFFDYTKAIKTCLRLNPDWIMLSEARSKEVKALLEVYSTGVKGLTTLHTDDVRKIPDRMLNMMQESGDAGRQIHDIYEFIHVGVLLREISFPDNTVRKVIDQVCYFEHIQGKNKVHMILDDRMLTNQPLPEQLMKHLQRAGILNPFQCVYLPEKKKDEDAA